MSLETERPDSESSQSSKWENVKNNEKVQQAKQVSQQYLKFFLQVLKSPVQSSKQVGEGHLINSWITLGLTAILVPLFLIFTSLRMGFGFSFTGLLLQPLIYIALVLAAAIGSILLIAKLYQAEVNPKQTLVQFGTLIIPVPVSFALALITGLIGMGVTVPVFFLALGLAFILCAMNLLIIQKVGNRNGKFDFLYSLVIANGIVCYILFLLITSSTEAILMSGIDRILDFDFGF